ncbi:unnamed protein product [Thelazia callipaeda]|uniref:cytochrome-c oxidase n=1 Tax=Thelazia callipaeda TaxID=103827 RepID=A0A0N5CXN1_THECL|nr:unnamed protein product [Thelazia callipaeda]
MLRKPLEDLRAGEFRLLEVDNRCVLPAGLSVGVYCTSGDVIHSFCLPKCFIKIDALSGLFYGQCSEICGANHSFMPIVLEVRLRTIFQHMVWRRNTTNFNRFVRNEPIAQLNEV